MRHRVAGKKLNRNTNQRKALFKTLAKQLLQHGFVTTTETKAKVIKRHVEIILNKGKDNSLHAQRQLLSKLGDAVVVKKVMADIIPNLKPASGGHITSRRVLRRQGDNTIMVRLEIRKEEKTVVKKASEDKNKEVKESKKESKK